MEKNELLVGKTHIPGLIVVRLHRNTDERGSFQEKLNIEKLKSLGVFPDFSVIQWNVSENLQAGVVRGLHAEPWNKYINVLQGEVFAAFVDLRLGQDRRVCTIDLDQDIAIFVPKGVANSYQTLTSNVIYGYVTDGQWQSGVTYQTVNVADPSLNIDWPIPLYKSIISEKDKANPFLPPLKSAESVEKEVAK